jgi:superfamily II DNA or RNA helicase
MKITLPIGRLAEYLEEFRSLTLEDNVEISTKDYGLSVHTPQGLANVSYFVKKIDLSVLEFEFTNGYKIKVAKKHIFSKQGHDVYASDLLVGDRLDHRKGCATISKIREVENADCFDISIPAPYLYYDAAGLVHHNTVITAALSDAIGVYGRSIVIVPNKSLVTQTEKDYVNMGLDVGVYFGDRKEYDRQHTICTWQSLNNMTKKTAAGSAEVTIQEFIKDVVCVIVDEVHQASADALKSLLTGVMSHIPIRWGLTGTVPKEMFESQSLLVSLGPVISSLSASTLQDAGVLAQCQVNIVQLVDHVAFNNYQSELKYLLEESGRLDTIAELVLRVNQTGNTLVLVDRVACGQELVSRLNGLAVFVSGSTKAKVRQAEYDMIANSTGKIIVATYGVAAVGINLPRIFNLVLLEPGKSFTRVIQSIGRGIRKAEDKDFVNIYDVTSTCKFAKRHLTKRKQFYKEAKYEFKQEKLEWMRIK